MTEREGGGESEVHASPDVRVAGCQLVPQGLSFARLQQYQVYRRSSGHSHASSLATKHHSVRGLRLCALSAALIAAVRMDPRYGS